MSLKICKEFDIVIFGASGLTGRYAVEELSLSVVKSPEIKWAIAGRNAERLKETLASVQEYLPDGMQVRGTQVIIADAQDPSSIYQMCKRTKLLLNCVGPYDLFGGEMIVSTCIECKTHCVDISAEIKHLDSVMTNLFEHARINGVYIVQSCGFGSLPADYGLTLLMKKMPGGLNSVEYFAEFGEGPTIEVEGFIKFPSFYQALRYFFAFLLYAVMSLFSVGRTLLQKYPSFFTAGIFSKEGPSRQQIIESSTKVTFYADGLKKKSADSEKQLTESDTKIKLTVTGPEAGYALTTMCMVQAAFTILQDSDKMFFKGGVFTPGVVFENTRLQERLEKRGMTFTFEEIS